MLLRPAFVDCWRTDNDTGLVIPRDPDVWGYVNQVRAQGGDIDDAGIENLKAFIDLCKSNGAWDKLQFAICAKWGRQDISGQTFKAFSPKQLSRFTQTNTSTRRPTFQATGMNGKPCWLFDGSDDVMAVQDAADIFRNVASATSIVVAQTIGNTGRRMFFWSTGSSGGTPRYLLDQTSTPAIRLSGRRNDIDTTGTTTLNVSTASPTILSAEADWVNSDSQIWANRGTTVQNTSWLTDGNVQDTASITRNIGADSVNSYNGTIAAVLHFVSKLTLAQRQGIESFFADPTTGYNITLT